MTMQLPDFADCALLLTSLPVPAAKLTWTELRSLVCAGGRAEAMPPALRACVNGATADLFANAGDRAAGVIGLELPLEGGVPLRFRSPSLSLPVLVPDLKKVLRLLAHEEPRPVDEPPDDAREFDMSQFDGDLRGTPLAAGVASPPAGGDRMYFRLL